VAVFQSYIRGEVAPLGCDLADWSVEYLNEESGMV